MMLGFYYHVTVAKVNNKIVMPSYLGIFIDELASHANTLYLFMHEANIHESNGLDYELKSTNIIWCNLGVSKPAWYKSIFHDKILKPHQTELNLCDFLIVRAPSPLAPYFHKYINRSKIFFMVVGDYKEGAKQFKINSIRDYVITLYLKHNDYLFRNQIRKTVTLVNSFDLFKTYTPIAKYIHQIRTTTLSQSDFFKREDTCQNEIIQLLYTGRIDRAKGLFELIEATALLSKNLRVQLNIVGWEINAGNKLENELKALAKTLGIDGLITFHGKKQIGEDLNAMYRMADLYIIPSYFEGFPRTIWEAMANSLPVITTAVGGIPSILKHEQDAILITPKSALAIQSAVLSLLDNAILRKTLITNGYHLAKENTLGIQTAKIIEIIKKYAQ